MKIQAVINYKEPNYPKLDDFLNFPAFIIQNAPDNWRSNKYVWAALVSFALGSQSCDYLVKKHTRIEIIQLHENSKEKMSAQQHSASDSSFVAPLFQHGNGIGAYGCVVIMPPVFINEQEAKQIILNELKKENLVFDTVTQPSQKIVIKTDKKLWKELNGEYEVKDTTEYNELVFDGYNADLNLAFCFVSNKKYADFTDYEEENSTVSLEDFKKTSEKLRNEIRKAKDVNAVVFYEPIPYPDRDKKHEGPSREKWAKEGRELAKDSIKAQVADFIKWLKVEKISSK